MCHSGKTHLDLLPVKVLNRWIVFFNETAGNELYGQRRFANTPRTKDYHFEFTHFSLWNFKTKNMPRYLLCRLVEENVATINIIYNPDNVFLFLVFFFSSLSLSLSLSISFSSQCYVLLYYIYACCLRRSLLPQSPFLLSENCFVCFSFLFLLFFLYLFLCCCYTIMNRAVFFVFVTSVMVLHCMLYFFCFFFLFFSLAAGAIRPLLFSHKHTALNYCKWI